MHRVYLYNKKIVIWSIIPSTLPRLKRFRNMDADWWAVFKLPSHWSPVDTCRPQHLSRDLKVLAAVEKLREWDGPLFGFDGGGDRIAES